MSKPIADILAAMPGRRILVIGDVMLDRFVYGRTERVSPEAPSLILAADRQEQMVGGAANVALNVLALGGRCHLVGLTGQDPIARELAEELGRHEGLAVDLVADPQRSTTLKIRLVNPQYNTHLLRLDWEVATPAEGAILEELTTRAVVSVGAAEVVILSDYLKGVLQPSLIAAVVAAAERHGIPVLVDPKGRDFARYRGVGILAPNLHELSLALGRTVPQEDAAVEAAAAELSEMTGAETIAVKRSQFGVQLVEAGRTTARLPTLARRVVDVSGAGDTLVAAFGMALAAGAGAEAAARVANAAAGVVVAKKGTAVVSAGELADLLLHRHEHRISGKIYTEAADLGAQVAAWQAEGLSVGFTNGCFDLLHPGHIWSLTQSRNRVDRLVLALNSDASVQRLKGPERPVQNEAARMTVAAALEAVDAVILFGEDTPLGLITALRPNVLFKGGDYSLETVVGWREVEAYGGRVEIIPYMPNTSTTEMIGRMRRMEEGEKRGIGTGSVIPSSATQSAAAAVSFEFPAEAAPGFRLPPALCTNAVHAAVEASVRWLRDLGWPFWLERGVDRAADGRPIGFHEYLSLEDLNCTAEFRRLRVVTRQTYVFSEALRAGFAPAAEAVDLGLEYLRTHAFDVDGGYHWRFGLGGQVIDPRRDLYDHAFVLLALAAAMRARPSAAIRAEALALDAYLQSVFRHPSGGYAESLPPSLPRRQNPHMHLLEACLAATDAFGADPFLDRAAALVDLFLDRLFQWREGALPEFFDSGLLPHREAGLFAVEPGHHAEWIWLLSWYRARAAAAGRPVPPRLEEAIAALVRFNDQFGLHPETRALMDRLWSDGSVADSGQRLWPQTERLKAEFLRPDASEKGILAAFVVLRSYVESAPPGLWMEQRLANGGFADMPAPASSLYHLTSAGLTVRDLVGSDDA